MEMVVGRDGDRMIGREGEGMEEKDDDDKLMDGHNTGENGDDDQIISESEEKREFVSKIECDVDGAKDKVVDL